MKLNFKCRLCKTFIKGDIPVILELTEVVRDKFFICKSCYYALRDKLEEGAVNEKAKEAQEIQLDKNCL